MHESRGNPGSGIVRPRRIEYLDGLRGLAAFSVMLGHARWPSYLATLPVLTNTSLWVDFFFVLSGFVIAFTYFDPLSRGQPVLAFMSRRFARLYPLHFVMLIVAVTVEFAKWHAFSHVAIAAEHQPFERNNAWSFVANLFLIQGLGIFSNVTWNAPSWSISTEFYTYLAFALLVAVSRCRPRLFPALLTAWLIVAWGLILLFSPRFMSVEADFGFSRCLIGFGFGVVVQRFYSEGESTGAITEALKYSLACAILALISLPTYAKFWTLAGPFVFATFIWVTLRYRGGSIEAVLSSSLCQWLGKLSYSIYMIHSVVRYVLSDLWRVVGRHVFFDAHPLFRVIFLETLTIGYVAAVLILAVFSYRYLEQPTQNWLNRRLVFGGGPKVEHLKPAA